MGFTTYTTPDGRWQYGTGEYDKTMAAYLGVNAPAPSTSLPGKLVDAMFPQKKVLQSMSYSVASSISIPVFYAWAKPAGEPGFIKKRIAEWPFAKSMRDAGFAGFRSAMVAYGVTDKQRVTLLNQLQATAGTPGMVNLAKLAAIEKQSLIYSEIDQRVRHSASDAAGGTVIVLLVAAAVGLFVVLS